MSEHRKTPEGSPEDDSGLVRAFQAGDRSAFDRIMLLHKNRVFSLCYWLLGDYQEANDAAQTTFVKVYRSLNGFRFESAFSTWLHRVAVNTCKNRIQSSEYREKKRTLSLDNPGTPNEGDRPVEIQDPAPSPITRLEDKERRRRIRDAIGALAPEHREVVTLRDIQGLSYDEVARVAGVNIGTVKSRLSRARLELKEKLVSVMRNGL